MSKTMHLTGFMLHAPAPHTQMSWLNSGKANRYQWTEPEYWHSIARTLERGKFDMFFFADQLAAYDIYGGTMDTTLRRAVQFPVHDPVVLISGLSAVTEKLGFGVTMSTTYYPPYLLVRKLSTLDHLTKGRIGWNIVTSFHQNEARNFGLTDMPAHAERYDRTDEYMEVCNQLWDSWDPDAVVMDQEQGVFADPAKVRKINFEGKWFKCTGPSCVVPSPQGRPVIIQAGASDRGRDFAAKHAECVFGIQISSQGMRKFSDDMRARSIRMGRPSDDLKIVWGVQPIIGATEQEAKAKQKSILDRVPLEAALTLMSGHYNYDLSQFDLDRSLEDLEIPGIQGMLEIFTKMSDRNLTLREAATLYGASVAMPQVVGTPEQVADQLQNLLAEGGGDGFQFTPAYYAPDYYEEIVDALIPILQKRGVFRQDYTGNTLREHIQQN